MAQATEAEAGADLFHSLYSSWSHSAGAVLSLCFLAGAYSHACDVITAYADLPMGVEVLVQIDRLVQLLETPIFTYLRLQLLQPARYPDLIRCLTAFLKFQCYLSGINSGFSLETTLGWRNAALQNQLVCSMHVMCAR